MKEKKILSNTELKAVLQDTLSFDEYLTLYKEVFGKDFPETISNSWGFPPYWRNTKRHYLKKTY